LNVHGVHVARTQYTCGILSTMRRVFVFVTIFFFLFLVASASFADTTKSEYPIYCSILFNERDVPKSYAPPVDFFSATQKLFITAICDGRESVTVEFGTGETTQYIYKYAYKKEGGKWKKMALSGANTVGSWIVGKATVELEGVKEGENGEVKAYICKKVEGVWKCGCSDKKCKTSKWNYQKYELTKENYKVALSFDLNESIKSIYEEYNIEEDALDVYFASKEAVFVGDKIMLTGNNFSLEKENEVLWDGVSEEVLASSNGTTLVINTPSLPPDKYEVKVRIGSEESVYGTNVWIKSFEKTTSPKITSVSPSIGKRGDVFTIYGEGFTSRNDVVTTFGVLEDIQSEDGKSITFIYDPFKNTGQAENNTYYYGNDFPVSIKVYNTSGISNASNFSLKI